VTCTSPGKAPAFPGWQRNRPLKGCLCAERFLDINVLSQRGTCPNMTFFQVSEFEMNIKLQYSSSVHPDYCSSRRVTGLSGMALGLVNPKSPR
jgi:hypothetical protein